jgi:hypothetical protein
VRRFLKLLSLPALALALGATALPAEAVGITVTRPAKLVAQQPQRQASSKQRVETIQPHRVPVATQMTANKGTGLTAGGTRAGIHTQRPGSVRLHQVRYPLR